MCNTPRLWANRAKRDLVLSGYAVFFLLFISVCECLPKSDCFSHQVLHDTVKNARWKTRCCDGMSVAVETNCALKANWAQGTEEREQLSQSRGREQAGWEESSRCADPFHTRGELVSSCWISAATESTYCFKPVTKPSSECFCDLATVINL